MFYGRLLLVVLLLCSLPVLAQDRSLIAGNVRTNVQQVLESRTPPAGTPSEPWRILPKSDSDKEKGSLVITPELAPQGVVVSPDGRLAGTTCYAIRSYVVARDSRDSDSVHRVAYWTCIPATRYQLKTADDHVDR